MPSSGPEAASYGDRSRRRKPEMQGFPSPASEGWLQTGATPLAHVSADEGTRRGLREMRRRWRIGLPAYANTGDPNGPLEACPLISSNAR